MGKKNIIWQREREYFSLEELQHLDTLLLVF